MGKFNADGNLLGRIGALAVIGVMALSLNKIICGGGACPFAKATSSCRSVEAPK